MASGREVLLRQAVIEVAEHRGGIHNSLQPRAIQQDRFVALPAVALNQLLVQGAIFIGGCQIEGPRLARAWGREKQQRFGQRDATPPVRCDHHAFLGR
jgi:hypothetical protein